MGAQQGINDPAMTDSLSPELLAEDWVFREQCPLCTAPASRSVSFEEADSEVGRLAYVICRACGFVYQAPYPSRSWLRSYYQGGYHLHVHGQQDPGTKTEWVETRRAESLLEFTQPHLSSVRNHLDIGSSLGKLLAAFQEVFGCQSHGVEPAEVYRQNARALGVDVVGRLDALDDGLRRGFDLVSISHVLEHLTQPVDILHRLRQEWMTEGAHLLVEVPNLFGHPSLEFAHLSAFTATTLIHALRRAGFAPIAVETHGQPHSRRLPFYVRMLARCEAESLQPPIARPSISMIRLKRRLGMLRLKAVWALSSRLLGQKRLAPWAR